jgi:MFS family permease
MPKLITLRMHLGRLSWKQTFTALQYRNYRLWFWGQLTSLFGSWMQSAAFGFLVFQLTHSTAFLGLTGFAAGAPTWLFMLYAGVVADRIPRRKLLLITQTAMMVLAFIASVLVFLNVVRPWHILVLAFGFGVANAFDAPARHAIVQELVDDAEDMTNAIALNGAMFNLATALGPAVGGLTYAAFGPGWCFAVNGLSFLAVIAALVKMKLRPFVPRPHVTSAFTDLKEGLRYVASHSMIRTIIILLGFITLFAFSSVTLLPAWAVKILHGNASTNGFLQSMRGLGALASALLIAALGRFKYRGRLLSAGSLAFPVLLIVFAFVRTEALSFLFLFASGFALILVFNLANAAVQSLTPDALRGRVMSIYSFTFFGSMPIGALFIGTLAYKVGEAEAVVLTAAITLAFTAAIFLFMPKLRRMA